MKWRIVILEVGSDGVDHNIALHIKEALEELGYECHEEKPTEKTQRLTVYAE